MCVRERQQVLKTVFVMEAVGQEGLTVGIGSAPLPEGLEEERVSAPGVQGGQTLLGRDGWLSPRRGTVLVHSGSNNRAPQTGGIRNSRHLFLTVLEAGCLRSRHLVSGETSFLVHRGPSPCSVSMWQKGQGSSMGSLL